jgi:electron-transferring-flavoprotein dehydrogenase
MSETMTAGEHAPEQVREQMAFDVVIVGAGPSGLAAAIRLKQLAPEAAVCVVEKGGEVGAHILSGAVIEPRALDELLPDWRTNGAPLTTEAKDDRFLYLTATRAIRLPTPPQMHNAGNYIGSLGNVCRWLGQQAEALGVEIYPGFAAAELLISSAGQVLGVATGDMGLTKEGEPGPNHQPGMELRAAYTIFAEGCRGSLTKQLMAKYGLRDGRGPQTYGLGIKELWEIPAAQHRPGLIEHTIGWPMDSKTYGGSWLYHWGENLVSYGYVVGLDYTNPWLSPFDEMQRLKTHPAMRPHFEGGRRISYGARALSEGGFQSIPKLTFPGGCLVGDAAGFLNVPKIKGTHAAMKSGMMAAEAVAEARAGGLAEPTGFTDRLRASWLHSELSSVRNIRPSFAKFGNLGGFVYSVIDTVLLRGRAPWTFHHPHADNEVLRPAAQDRQIAYPKPDGTLTFDRLSSVFISNTNHEEDQPVHLKLRDPARWLTENWQKYQSPESRYCPAGVYEAVGVAEGNPHLQINAQNCVHCKTCDIKDPTQNIDWAVPEGGGGPNYPGGM